MIKYYFFIEFSWDKKTGFTPSAIPRVKFFPDFEQTNKYGSVNYSILESLFLSDNKLKEIRFIESLIANIQRVIDGSLESTGTSCETESLEIKKDFSRPIDNLDMHGSNPPIDGRNSWNVSTPKELQYIPTKLILQLFEDWRQFLIAQANIKLEINL